MAALFDENPVLPVEQIIGHHGDLLRELVVEGQGLQRLGHPGRNLQAATSAGTFNTFESVLIPRERSNHLREFGLKVGSTSSKAKTAKSQSRQQVEVGVDSHLDSDFSDLNASSSTTETIKSTLCQVPVSSLVAGSASDPSNQTSSHPRSNHQRSFTANSSFSSSFEGQNDLAEAEADDWPCCSTSNSIYHENSSTYYLQKAFQLPSSRFSTATDYSTTTTASSIPQLRYGSESGTPSPPRSPTTPISPRWDSLAYNSNKTYVHDHYKQSPQRANVPAYGICTSAPVLTHPARPSTPKYVSAQRQRQRQQQQQQLHPKRLDSLAVGRTHKLSHSSQSPIKKQTNMYSPEPGSIVGETMGVDNFSRPRRPSVKHASPDPYCYRPGYSPPLHEDSTQQEYLNHPNQYLLARERGQSITSNKSASSFASLPVRPSPDLNYRDSVRGRSRHAHPPFSRQPMMYSRTDSSGHSFPREPLPRMASMPSDELRSSYRSQLSASTAPGTLHTERSSVLTKSSSVTSIYVPVDDGFSVDDVMGMYEKGFRDDSPAPGQLEEEDEEDESRPPTGKSELSRRKTALLEAFSDSLPIERAFSGNERERQEDAADTVPNIDVQAPLVSKAEMAAIRESTAIFSSVETAALAEAIVENDESDKPVGHADDNELVMRSQQPQPIERVSFENTDITRDRYGFKKGNQYVTQQQYDSWNAGYSDYMERRRRKWQVLMKESGLITDNPIRFPPISAKTKRFVRKGIPPEWRGAAWFYYAGGPAILAKHGGIYDQLLGQTAKDIDKEAIERDLHRTFPDNVKFRAANTSSVPNTEDREAQSSDSTTAPMKGPAPQPGETPMISSLRRVLHAFSIYNPRIGYCQSLNFLAGLLLLFTETEEQSFWLLNIITRVYLPGTHETSLEGANVDLGVLMTSVQESMPAVWSKIGGELDGTDAAKPKSRRHRKGAIPTRLPPVTLCMTAWFMSCFIGTLPIETTLRVWDVFFYEGSKTLFRIALTIFKLGENEIKSVGDPMEIFQVVQTIPRRLLDANAMMEACFRRRNGFGHISQDTIEERRLERRRNVKAEKERMAAGLAEDPDSFKRKNTFFGRKQRPVDVM